MATSHPDRRRATRMEILGLTGLAIAKLAVHLATNATYGFHRDELYYLASGRHPALGYVDYPPLTPLLARFELDLFGPSVFWLRLFPALAGAILVVLAGLIAAELGGGTFARLAAATATLACPLLLARWRQMPRKLGSSVLGQATLPQRLLLGRHVFRRSRRVEEVHSRFRMADWVGLIQ